MNRRQWLVAGGAVSMSVLAGCALPSQASDPERATNAGTNRSRAMIGTEATLEIVDVSDHEEDDVTFEAELFDGSTDEPPEIEFRLTNVGPARQFFFGAMPPFSAVLSESAALTLIPHDYGEYIGPMDPDGPTEPDEFIPDSREGGCWRALARPLKLSVGNSIRLDRNETKSVRYTVLVRSAPEVACPPTGSHRVTSPFSINGVNENVNEAAVTLGVE